PRSPGDGSRWSSTASSTSWSARRAWLPLQLDRQERHPLREPAAGGLAREVAVAQHAGDEARRTHVALGAAGRYTYLTAIFGESGWLPRWTASSRRPSALCHPPLKSNWRHHPASGRGRGLARVCNPGGRISRTIAVSAAQFQAQITRAAVVDVRY